LSGYPDEREGSMRRIGRVFSLAATAAIVTAPLLAPDAQAAPRTSTTRVIGQASCKVPFLRPTGVRFQTFGENAESVWSPVSRSGYYSVTVRNVDRFGRRAHATVFCPAKAGGPWTQITWVSSNRPVQRINLRWS